ncbi:MAG: L-serine ammonia-lyase [Gammaproteobacteria bacterium]
MSFSVFDILKIGVGPSSSHTMGPMNAAARFVDEIDKLGSLTDVVHVTAELFGSLALTGIGHCTDTAVLLGLEGISPETLDPDEGQKQVQRIRKERKLHLSGRHAIAFDEELDLLFLTEQYLPEHPNGMRFTAFDAHEQHILQREYFSTGGGFITSKADVNRDLSDQGETLPFAFTSAAHLLEICHENSMTIAELAMANELHLDDEITVRGKLMKIWSVMRQCVERGFSQTGKLPGVLGVTRRAPRSNELLIAPDYKSPTLFMDWVTAWALSVNEENAAGGKVVTAPTNGAAGIVPAVIHYYLKFEEGADEEGVIRFLLVAAAIGSLYKMNASISGAEMGCQGEVGVACSMAAGGLVAALNGSNEKIENAAEIGMEHNLGLTCDPIAGLVQIPCIERNAMGAVKAINASRLALRGDGSHKVSLDQVIETMRQTGMDMNSVYKETSRGGLAVNVTEC